MRDSQERESSQEKVSDKILRWVFDYSIIYQPLEVKIDRVYLNSWEKQL
jgi:phosphoribulokinase